MNKALRDLASSVGLDEPGQKMLRWRFGLACATRVEHLLEAPGALACLASLSQFVTGTLDAASLDRAAQEIARISNPIRVPTPSTALVMLQNLPLLPLRMRWPERL
ncbi:hypothetical protein [Variovorax sp. J31P207]|uniref:hypothetical protein n=1 Tax=Variovorax sp. J31P207 TaxID=3053510 RepID=UPI0033656FCF